MTVVRGISKFHLHSFKITVIIIPAVSSSYNLKCVSKKAQILSYHNLKKIFDNCISVQLFPFVSLCMLSNAPKNNILKKSKNSNVWGGDCHIRSLPCLPLNSPHMASNGGCAKPRVSVLTYYSTGSKIKQKSRKQVLMTTSGSRGADLGAAKSYRQSMAQALSCTAVWQK